jgi:hypothetical protein
MAAAGANALDVIVCLLKVLSTQDDLLGNSLSAFLIQSATAMAPTRVRDSTPDPPANTLGDMAAPDFVARFRATLYPGRSQNKTGDAVFSRSRTRSRNSCSV